MNQFEMVKLAVDVGLGMCLLYLAIRFLRGGISDKQARQLAGLDASLKALIREAEVSGNNLNDQLMRRQQAMEGTLREIESTESRLQRSLSAAKELSSTLEDQLKKVREDLLDVERRRVRLETVREPAPAPQAQPQPVRARAAARPAPAPIPEPELIEETEFELIEDENDDSPPIEFGKVNIFGEPIEESDAAPAPAPARSALQQAVEKIVESKRTASASGFSKPILDAVHAAAEEMLRAGRNLEAVAARTKLPLDEVRSLSQKIIKDSILQEGTSGSAELRAQDQRLGVLGATRRQDQVV